jgi:cytochrome c2
MIVSQHPHGQEQSTSAANKHNAKRKTIWTLHTFQNICHETNKLNPKSKHSVKAPKLMFLCFTGKERRTSVIAFMSALWSVFTGPEQAVATQQHATKIW